MRRNSETWLLQAQQRLTKIGITSITATELHTYRSASSIPWKDSQVSGSKARHIVLFEGIGEWSKCFGTKGMFPCCPILCQTQGGTVTGKLFAPQEPMWIGFRFTHIWTLTQCFVQCRSQFRWYYR